MITYCNKYFSLVTKKCDFGLDSDYRTEMHLFLLVILASLFQGNDILQLDIDTNSAMNMVWITILVEQVLNQLIENNKKSKEK